VTEERPTHETLLDFFVYAPLGAALVFADELPRLAERGRERVEKRVAVARMVGRFAVGEARRRLGAAREQTDGPEEATRLAFPARDDSLTPSGPPAREPSVADLYSRTRLSGSRSAGKTAPPGTAAPAASASGRGLPIPAYDTLAASQVVERLASLTAAELEVVRDHESATRRRRTVLHRIAQLSSELGSTTA